MQHKYKMAAIVVLDINNKNIKMYYEDKLIQTLFGKIIKTRYNSSGNHLYKVDIPFYQTQHTIVKHEEISHVS